MTSGSPSTAWSVGCAADRTGQKRALMRARRPAATRSSPAPTTSKSSSRCSRAWLRSSPEVARTVSTRRAKASSTWPPRRSRSATRIWAATSVGFAAAAALGPRRGRRPRYAASGRPGPAPPSPRRRPGSPPAPARRPWPRRRGHRPRSRRRRPRCAAAARLRRPRRPPRRRSASSGAGLTRPVTPFWTATWSSSSMTGCTSCGSSGPDEQRQRPALEQRDGHRDLLDLERPQQPGVLVDVHGDDLEPALVAEARGRP